jgi:hypothetical protein
MTELMRCNKIGAGSKLVSAAQPVGLLQIEYAGTQKGQRRWMGLWSCSEDIVPAALRSLYFIRASGLY